MKKNNEGGGKTKVSGRYGRGCPSELRKKEEEKETKKTENYEYQGGKKEERQHE